MSSEPYDLLTIVALGNGSRGSRSEIFLELLLSAVDKQGVSKKIFSKVERRV
jgi:hypothetical protein